MAVIGELIVNLRAHTASFSKDLKKATNLAFGSSREIERSFKIIGAAAATAAGAAAGALLVIAERTGAYAEEISNASQKTGIAVEDLQRLKFAGEQAAVGFDAIQTGLKVFSKALSGLTESKEAERAFAALNIGARDAEGNLRPLHDLLLDIAERFQKTKDSGEKAAIAASLFGRAGTDLIPVLNLGREGLLAMERQADALGIVLGEKDVEAASRLDDQIGMLRASMQGLEFTAAKMVIPTLNELLTTTIALSQVGFPSLTQALRDAAAGMVKAQALMNPLSNSYLAMSKAAGWVTGKDYLGDWLDQVTLKIMGGEKRTEDLTDKILKLRQALSLLTATGEAPPSIEPVTKKAKAKGPKFTFEEVFDFTQAKSLLVWQEQLRILGAETGELTKKQAELGEAIRAAGLDEMAGNMEEASKALRPVIPAFDKLSDGARQFGRAMESAFTQLILHGASFKETLRGLTILIAEMILKATVFKSIARMFDKGGLLSGLGGLFGGLGGLPGRASGGPVMAGAPYLVGERGPEVFVPAASGKIVPGGKAGGLVIQIDARGADGGVESKVMRALAKMEARSARAAQLQMQQALLRSV